MAHAHRRASLGLTSVPCLVPTGHSGNLRGMNEAGVSGDGLGDGELGFCSMSYTNKRKSQEWRSGHSRKATTSSQRRRGLLWGHGDMQSLAF